MFDAPTGKHLKRSKKHETNTCRFKYRSKPSFLTFSCKMPEVAPTKWVPDLWGSRTRNLAEFVHQKARRNPTWTNFGSAPHFFLNRCPHRGARVLPWLGASHCLAMLVLLDRSWKSLQQQPQSYHGCTEKKV